MRKNSLSAKEGLSMSQAQSLSNIVNQESNSINQKIGQVNNYSTTIKVAGETHTLKEGLGTVN